MEIYTDMKNGLAGADIVMMLRLQLERMAGALCPPPANISASMAWTAKNFLAKPGALVMHPGPMNRGVEIACDIADDVRSA